MKTISPAIRRLILLFSVFTCLFSGCNMPKKGTLMPTEIPTEIIEIPTEEPTPEPTEVPRISVRLISSVTAPGNFEVLSKALSAYCESRYEFQISDDPEINADYVFFSEVPADPDGLTSRHTETHYVFMSAEDEASSGTAMIRYNDAFLPFLAGVATSENAYDWRGLGLLPENSSLLGSHCNEAFLNGAHYFCGACRGSLSPYVNFPLTVSLPVGSPAERWNAGIDEAQNSFIYTVFIADEAAQIEVFQHLLPLNVRMLGFSEPPAGLEDNWLASINYDWDGLFDKIIVENAKGLLYPELRIIPGTLSEDFSAGKGLVLKEAYEKLLDGRLSPLTPVKEYSSEN